MIDVTARVDGVGHEEPGEDAGGEPQKERLPVDVGGVAHAHGEREPVDEDVDGGLGEEPHLAEGGAAVGLDQVELGEVPDLVTPLPVLSEYLLERAEQCMPPRAGPRPSYSISSAPLMPH